MKKKFYISRKNLNYKSFFFKNFVIHKNKLKNKKLKNKKNLILNFKFNFRILNKLFKKTIFDFQTRNY